MISNASRREIGVFRSSYIPLVPILEVTWKPTSGVWGTWSSSWPWTHDPVRAHNTSLIEYQLPTNVWKIEDKTPEPSNRTLTCLRNSKEKKRISVYLNSSNDWYFVKYFWNSGLVGMPCLVHFLFYFHHISWTLIAWYVGLRHDFHRWLTIEPTQLLY